MQRAVGAKAVALRICALFLLRVASASHKTNSRASKCPKNQNHQSPPFRTWDTSDFSYMKFITLSRLFIERKFHDSAFLISRSTATPVNCSPPSLNSLASERLFSISSFFCFWPLNSQLSAVNFFSAAL